MITKNTIILDKPSGPCFAHNSYAGKIVCGVLTKEDPTCGCSCPFYKPRDCSDWIRIEDGHQIYIIPAEEYFEARGSGKADTKKIPTWKIRRVHTHAVSAGRR